MGNILNLDQLFWRRCGLKILNFLSISLAAPLFSGAEPFVQLQYNRGHYQEHFCETILNLDQLFRRCCSKDFFSRVLAAVMFSGVEPFVQSW